MPVLGGVGKDTVVEAGKQASSLEQQTAADVRAVVDQLAERFSPEVQRICAAVERIAQSFDNMTVGITGSVALAAGKVDRGLRITIELGPEPGK